jgi:hypothetical protein
MRLLPEILSDSDIQSLRSYWDRYNQHSYINCWTYDGHVYQSRSKHIDRRLVIAEQTVQGSIIRNIVDNIWPDQKQSFWANYQRQSVCHQLHVDEYGTNRQNPTWTIIIALDTVPEWKAVIFKEQFNSNDELNNYIAKIDYSTPPCNDYSQLYDLDHMDKWVGQDNYNFCNWFELDGVFEYQAGHGVLFDTNQAHTTNNWPKWPQFSHRDLVQIHVGTSVSSSSNFHDIKKGGETVPTPEAVLEKLDAGDLQP